MKKELDTPRHTEGMVPEIDARSSAPPKVDFAWLEITGKCQLNCLHCYADSSPQGTHGNMSEADWCQTIDGLSKLGVSMIQLIGGEPTLQPNFPGLLEHALSKNFEVEVYSNLTHISPKAWELFSQSGVSLATSYYSSHSFEHEAITRGRGSYKRTRTNIVEALRRGIPLHVGIIEVLEGQAIEEAEVELRELGVRDIETDILRGVGRGAVQEYSGPEEFCGNCGDGVIAVLSDGTVTPCVFSRDYVYQLGNVKQSSLQEVLRSQTASSVLSDLQFAFTGIEGIKKCRPQCSPNCAPAAGEPCNPACPPNCLPKRGGKPPTK